MIEWSVEHNNKIQWGPKVIYYIKLSEKFNWKMELISSICMPPPALELCELHHIIHFISELEMQKLYS